MTSHEQKNTRAPLGARMGLTSRDSLPETMDLQQVDPTNRFGLRPYQQEIFGDQLTGVVVLHWARQIGKSYALAAWAVDRLTRKLKSHRTWLVTVLSNSRENGSEFVRKCHDASERIGARAQSKDCSADLRFSNMRFEVKVDVTEEGKTKRGRIKVLAANPRTARGFSGDLILDEFGFHEDSAAIWEAAEPILASHPNYQCRIASTGNGRHNLFYQLCAGESEVNNKPFLSSTGYVVRRFGRTGAWTQGVPVYDTRSREEITPKQARARALDPAAYDQNYECQFNDENQCLLTIALIEAAQAPGEPMDAQTWSSATLQRLQAATGLLYLGMDVGRQRDWSVQCVLEKNGDQLRVVGMLRLAGVRLPDQQRQLERICRLDRFRGACLDMSGLGLGLVEYAQDEPWGGARIRGINFATTENIHQRAATDGRTAARARVTENLAVALLTLFEQNRLEIAVELDQDAFNDLRKPERITSPGGRVSICAVRDEAGHADHFWALALAVRATEGTPEPGEFHIFQGNPRSRALAARRQRHLET